MLCVTFQENTCILTFCMYFTRIPNHSPRYILGYTSDTSRYMYLLASYVSHWIHNRIHQDTSRYSCILDSSSQYIKIHQEIQNPSRYMYLGCVMMTLQDTFQIHHDTCILDASSEPRWIHTRYVRDAIQIRSRYVSRYPLGSFYLPCCPRS